MCKGKERDYRTIQKHTLNLLTMPDTTDIEIVQSDTSSTQQDLADNCDGSISSSTQHDSDSTDDPKEILSKKREETGFTKKCYSMSWRKSK